MRLWICVCSLALGCATAQATPSSTPTAGTPEEEPCPTALIGDSTAEGLDPSPWTHFEAAGGRSLVEHRKGRETGTMVAQRLIDAGFVGCWVIVLGTNDAANLSVGRGEPATRIRRMLDTIGPSPVLWIDATTIRTRGAYRSQSMVAWNDALHEVLAAYPNATVHRWSETVELAWFSDGIHYTRDGMAQRSAAIEHAVPWPM